MDKKGYRYAVVHKVEEATHWLALVDEKNQDIHITPFQSYKILFNPYDAEYLIRDDDGDMTDIHRFHSGYLVKEE